MTKEIWLYVCLFQGPSSSPGRKPGGGVSAGPSRTPSARKTPSLKGVDPKLAQIILDEILEGGPSVSWEDIAGQEVSRMFLPLI